MLVFSCSVDMNNIHDFNMLIYIYIHTHKHTHHRCCHCRCRCIHRVAIPNCNTMSLNKNISNEINIKVFPWEAHQRPIYHDIIKYTYTKNITVNLSLNKWCLPINNSLICELFFYRKMYNVR